MNGWRNKWFTCNWWLSKEIRALTDYLCFQVQNFTFLSDRTSLSINTKCFFFFQVFMYLPIYIIVVAYNMLSFKDTCTCIWFTLFTKLEITMITFFSVQICLWLRQNQVSQECGMSNRTFFGLQVRWKKVNIYWSIFYWNKCFYILYFDIQCPELGHKWICLSDKVCICMLFCLWMFDVLNFFCITCTTVS